MVPQNVKDALFAVNRIAVVPNIWLARARFRRAAAAAPLAVHLGCGTHYIEGMINCDGNVFRKTDVWLDVRQPLPFPDDSAGLVYTSHMLEHLFPDEAKSLLREIRRILSPSGVARVVVPDAEHALKIVRGESTCPWPRDFADPLAQAVNYLFCDGQHKYAYNFALLAQFAREAGFGDVRHISAEHGVSPRLYGNIPLGNEPDGSLVVELRRS
jgi:predicted SAM-dependent methyltransferase